MLKLEEVKKVTELSDFQTDGCSGNVSQAWSVAIKQLSRSFPSVDQKYQDATRIPFEDACILHDRAYHKGEGGYVARLQADNALRQAILDYAIHNTEEIMKRTGVQTSASALFFYEMIADIVYRGVRLGGAPCSGEAYAWGYGYNGGVCN